MRRTSFQNARFSVIPPLLVACLLGSWSARADADTLVATDALDLQVQRVSTHLVVQAKFHQQDPSVPICRPNDSVYVWNEDENGYRYFMIGQGPGRRENLWVGVGHSEMTGFDYLMISVRNIDAQFGRFYPQNLVRAFTLNGVRDPGTVEDGGFGIYPERTIDPAGIDGVESITARSSLYELGTNHFQLRLNLANGRFRLADLREDHIAVLADGEVKVKLSVR